MILTIKEITGETLAEKARGIVDLAGEFAGEYDVDRVTGLLAQRINRVLAGVNGTLTESSVKVPTGDTPAVRALLRAVISKTVDGMTPLERGAILGACWSRPKRHPRRRPRSRF